MSSNGSIDTSGATPSVDAARLAATVFGTVIWGWVNGLLTFGSRLSGGVWSTVDDVAAWLSAPAGDGLVATLLAVPVNALRAGVAANAAFLAGLGAWGQVVAILESMGVLVLIILTIETVLSRAARAL